MRADLIKMIRQLTEGDTKSLSEKFTKLAEESGELARVILPYAAAAGTRHRFVTKGDILEEIADCSLVLMSMVYDLGLDEEDLWVAMGEKSQKWAKIQNADMACKSQIPFEIHVTVEAPVNAEHFRKTCKDLEVKPIILALQAKDETIMSDVMTSSVFLGDNAGVLEEIKRISGGLSRAGYRIVREKVETVPWHPAAPRIGANDMVEGQYFECHLNIRVDANTDRVLLKTMATENDCHLSSNNFKEYDDGSAIIMMTFRRHKATREGFTEQVATIKNNLLSRGFIVEKEIIEFAIFDTKINHDTQWTGVEDVKKALVEAQG